MSSNPFLTDSYLMIDSVHQELGLETELGMEVWKSKYRWKDEKTLDDMFQRVASAIYANDAAQHAEMAYWAMSVGLWMPAGRILAGAGTAKRVTLMNCFVNTKLPDSMEGIMQGNSNAALTMQQGGGMGTSFGTLRPAGALLKRTHTRASGPLPFMDMFDSMGKTVRSAGDRRGAQMMTLPDHHPDIPAFIVAKQTSGRLTETNISIMVSDAFMEAIQDDEDWLLYFPCEPADRDEALAEYDFMDEETGEKNWVYAKWRARDLWELITKNTYEYSEPGVIFIDRVNDRNNLHYCEEIICTNPCGEQPLPANGTCNLGHVVLSRMVKSPFTAQAHFNWATLRAVVAIGQRFLDNVIDVTGYPLEVQEAEERQKRRTGLGFTGLADVFNMLGIRYGSPQSAELAERIMKEIALASYRTSAELALERGAFPLFDAEKYLDPETFAGSMLPRDIQETIRQTGIRNGVLNTVAPTGTTSIVYMNGSSGLEPVFAHSYQRRVRGKEREEWTLHTVEGYSSRLYKHLNPGSPNLPSHMVTMADLSVDDHVIIQARVQAWVDASVSKTVNIPTEMSYEEFVRVYSLAYQSGCKGCTTYRPSNVRGSILSVEGSMDGKNAKNGGQDGASKVLRLRPEQLVGRTYKIKWPRLESSLYITINDDEDGKPFEMFINSKDGTSSEWMMALSLMITAIFRTNPHPDFISKELGQIQSFQGGCYINKVYYGSLPAYLGYIISAHMNKATTETIVSNAPVGVTIAPGKPSPAPSPAAVVLATPSILPQEKVGETCPSCKAPALQKVEGCKKCQACGYSSC